MSVQPLPGDGKRVLYCRRCSFPRVVLREVRPCLKCGGLAFTLVPPSLQADAEAVPAPDLKLSRNDVRFLRSLRIDPGSGAAP